MGNNNDLHNTKHRLTLGLSVEEKKAIQTWSSIDDEVKADTIRFRNEMRLFIVTNGACARAYKVLLPDKVAQMRNRILQKNNVIQPMNLEVALRTQRELDRAITEACNEIYTQYSQIADTLPVTQEDKDIVDLWKSLQNILISGNRL